MYSSAYLALIFDLYVFYICRHHAIILNMSQEKVNPGLPLTDDRVDNASEGLRVLARMIARRLEAKKADVGEQHHRSRPPLGGVNEKTGSQSSEMAHGKCPDESGGADG